MDCCSFVEGSRISISAAGLKGGHHRNVGFHKHVAALIPINAKKMYS